MTSWPMYRDLLKWLMALGLVGAGLFLNHQYSEMNLAIRLLGALLAFVFLLFLLKGTEKGARVWRFMQEARLELKKVVWPTRQETGRAALLVLGVVFIAALFFWTLDALLLKSVGWITGYGA